MTCPKSHGEGMRKLRFASPRGLLSEVRGGSGFGAGVLVLADDPLWPPGTLCLWMFWPSFNSVLLPTPGKRKSAMLNTYYALAASAVTAISMSALAHPQGKINMVRRGAAPWATLGSSRPRAHIHTCSPQHRPWFGKVQVWWWSLVSCAREREEEHCVIKRALELGRLRTDQRLAGGGGGGAGRGGVVM